MSGFIGLLAIAVALVYAGQVSEADLPPPPVEHGEGGLASTAVFLPAILTPQIPLPIPKDEPIHFAVIGDYGNGSGNEAAVASLVHSWPIDFIITTGDNNYPDGTAGTIDTNIGQFYGRYIYPYQGSYQGGTAPNRFFPSPGNHDWKAADLRPYRDYFPIDSSQTNTGSSGNERYYDFTQGPVHFFVIDSGGAEPDGNGVNSIQATWLKTQLAQSQLPWQIVYFHHPPYSSSSHGSNATMKWPFAEWGADAVFNGHDHTYERIEVGGIPYFVNGLGGMSIYNFGTPVAGSQVRYNGNYGAMLVEATETYVTFEFYAISGGGTLVDRHTILANGQSCSGQNGTTLLPAGSVWRYLDDGSDVGTGWYAPNFNDTTWSMGTAVLGFGDNQTTKIWSRQISYYFRKTFTVPTSADFDYVNINLLRDDGAVVYLNGVEILRSNMPDGPIVPSTLALESVGGNEETSFLTISIPSNLILNGTNVLAVQVHQVSTSSSDISFDLAVTAGKSSCPGLIMTGSVEPTAVSVSETVTFTYQISNVGTVDLHAIQATSSLLGDVPLISNTLALGEGMMGILTYTVKSVDLPGPLMNTISVIGTPPVGQPISAVHTIRVTVLPSP